MAEYSYFAFFFTTNQLIIIKSARCIVLTGDQLPVDNLCYNRLLRYMTDKNKSIKPLINSYLIKNKR